MDSHALSREVRRNFELFSGDNFTGNFYEIAPGVIVVAAEDYLFYYFYLSAADLLRRPAVIHIGGTPVGCSPARVRGFFCPYVEWEDAINAAKGVIFLKKGEWFHEPKKV